MFSFESLANKCVVPVARKTDDAVAVAVPWTANKACKATQYSTEKLGTFSKWLGEKAENTVKATEKALSDAAAQRAAKLPVKQVDKAVVSPQQGVGVPMDMVVEAFYEMSPVERLSFCLQFPDEARYIKAYRQVN